MLREENEMVIDASGLTYKELNGLIRDRALSGAEKIFLRNVYGQRYIGTRLYSLTQTQNSSKPGTRIEIEVWGTPGNDLGAFLDGHRVVVHGNAQDGVGNTMNDGEIVVEGRAGDITGMSMRGGEVFIRDGVGYRGAVHMKEYLNKRPLLVIGGTAQDFLGEYMAGGVVVLLGLNATHSANFIGTGMHGGVIYIKGKVGKHQLGKEVGTFSLNEKDKKILEDCVGKFTEHFDVGIDQKDILHGDFIKILPVSKRPYGRVYTY